MHHCCLQQIKSVIELYCIAIKYRSSPMRIIAVNNSLAKQNYNCKNPKQLSFGMLNTAKSASGQKSYTEAGKSVLAYIKAGCPKTDAGKELLRKTFLHNGESFFNPLYNNESIKGIIRRCNNNPELIYRVTGKYGLELYGGLEIGSTLKDSKTGIIETGYFAPDSSIWNNFINYIYYNQKGTLADIDERFGEHASSYYFDSLGEIDVGLVAYEKIHDYNTDDMFVTVWNTARDNAIHDTIYNADK